MPEEDSLPRLGQCGHIGGGKRSRTAPLDGLTHPLGISNNWDARCPLEPNKTDGATTGGLSWLGVALILSGAAVLAALGIWYVNKPAPVASFAALAAGTSKDVKQLKENIALLTKAYQRAKRSYRCW